jgi:DNA-binding transcriptional MerR regulator
MDGSWKIAELAELAAGVLAADHEPSGRPARANGRVRDVPNERLIRWYVTVGLLDPPLSRRGRVAWYDARHLLQLVAIKRLQAEGRSLAEIQAELAGATNASLAGVARVPDAVLAAGGAVARPGAAAAVGTTGPAARAARARRAPAAAARSAPAPGRLAAGTVTAAGASQASARFWAQRPGPPAAAPARPGPGGEGGPPAARADAGQGGAGAHRDPARLAAGARLAPGVWLAPGVTLLLDGAEREPSAEDLAAIAAAAGPLLDVLASARLRPADPSASLAAAAPGRPPDDRPHRKDVRSRT